MADPKATYYSPSEKGWATVLPSGPNFMGLAMQNEAIKARREQNALAQKQKADMERERQIAKIVGDLSKPVPTAFPYQEEVSKMKDGLLAEIQDMYYKNADPSAIRFRAATGVQELIAYANSGKQVYEGILSQTKQLDQKKYKIEEINRGLVDKIVGENGKPLNPSDVDPRDLSATDFVYKSATPWAYLNENVVVKDFLKSDAFKKSILETQQNLDEGKIGRFTQFNKETKRYEVVTKLWSQDPISEEFKFNDPATLIKNGVFQLMLADRDMAAVVDGHVARLTENRTTPLNEDSKDLLRASVLQDILENNVPGPSTIERINSTYSPTYTGGGTSQWEQKKAEFEGGMNNWRQMVGSSSAQQVETALSFLDNPLGASENSMSGLNQAFGNDPEFEFRGVTNGLDIQKNKVSLFGKNFTIGNKAIDPNALYAKFYDPNEEKYVVKKINQSYFTGETGLNLYNKQANNANRPFGGNVTYGNETQQPVTPKKGKYDKK